MRFRLIETNSELQKLIKSEINLDAKEIIKPVKFPCIAIIAYAGAGFDEIDFVYKDNFKQEKL